MGRSADTRCLRSTLRSRAEIDVEEKPTIQVTVEQRVQQVSSADIANHYKRRYGQKWNEDYNLFLVAFPDVASVAIDNIWQNGNQHANLEPVAQEFHEAAKGTTSRKTRSSTEKIKQTASAVVSTASQTIPGFLSKAIPSSAKTATQPTEVNPPVSSSSAGVASTLMVTYPLSPTTTDTRAAIVEIFNKPRPPSLRRACVPRRRPQRLVLPRDCLPRPTDAELHD